MSKQVNWHNSKLHYDAYGANGPKLMLVHGFGEDASVFEKQVAHLKDRCHLIVPHLPGTNPSVVSEEDVAKITIHTMADGLRTIADADGWDQFILLGHSMGGYITLNFADRFPERLKAFGLIHSTAYADTEEKKANRRKSISFIEENGSLAFFKTMIPGLFGPDFNHKHPKRVEQMVEAGDGFEPAVLKAYYKTMMERPDRTGVLKQAKVPVLMVAGEYDKAAPLADLEQQANLSKHTRFNVLRHSGHMSMLEEPDLLNEILESFISVI